MPKDELSVLRQYDFSWGPNYTDSIYSLKDKEIADSENVIWDGTLKRIPGGFPYLSSSLAGTNHNVLGIFGYRKQNQEEYVMYATDQGKIFYSSGASTVTTLKSGLSTNARTFWDWLVFNNTLIALSGRNSPQKWFATSGTMTTLGGTPPNSRYGIQHAVDYVFLAGHDSNRSEIRYSDTATAETWPVGNSLIIGRQDGQIITGLERLGDVTVVFKEGSIWTVSGNSPDDFTISPTPSDIGCIAPNTIVKTDQGIFFWSEQGPAIFNGFRSTTLGKRLKDFIPTIDLSRADQMCAVYNPLRKQVWISYPRVGQTYNDRMLVFDMYRYNDQDRTPPVFWPVTAGGASSMTVVNMLLQPAGQHVVFLGQSNGQALTLGESTSTWAGVPIVNRMRSGGLHLGKPDHVQLIRDITLRLKAQTARVAVRFSIDGNQTFTTHASTPYDTTKSGHSIHQKMLEGDGSGYYPAGNILQLDITSVGSTAWELHGYEIGSEVVNRREPQ